ncbi:MAG TPA: hypothetical protein VG456_09185 [Candidatus Sulfopaludibacter sp.]|jgi:hypothetical protein|nr:hypothetical protein [Candidatus Sulfopaludibacter sp.]
MPTKTLAAIGAVTLLCFSGLADDGHNNNNNNNNNNGNSSFQSSLIGSTPGMAVAGIASGGAPWLVNQGQVSIDSNGRIQLQVQGLLLGPGAPAAVVGTTGPVTMVAATLVCGGTGGMAVAVPDLSIAAATLSSSGDAQIDQTVTLPASCVGPVVLVRIFSPSAALGSQLGPFIAASGLMAGTQQNQNQNQDGHDHDR